MPGSRGRATAVKASEKARMKKGIRLGRSAVDTGVPETRVDKVDGFESARGKVSQSNGRRNANSIMRAKRGVEISAFNC